MIPRHVAAGTSRVLRRRAYTASPAASETSTNRWSDPTPSTSTATNSTTTSAERVRVIREIVHSPLPDKALRDRAWKIYQDLTVPERKELSTEDLRGLLRSLVPQYDEKWRLVTDVTPRERYQHKRVVETSWKRRMDAVLAELTHRNVADIYDWTFVLQYFSTVGAVQATERLVAELPPALRTNVKVTQWRIGAIVQRTRDMAVHYTHASTGDLDAAHSAFWDICRAMQDAEFKFDRFTLRLLLEASSQLAGLVQNVNPSAFEALDNFIRFLLKDAWSIDLANLPLSVQQREHAGVETTFRRLSAKGLVAVMSHITRCEKNPFRVIAAFDLLTTMKGRVDPDYFVNDEEEMEGYDDEDAGPALSAAMAQQDTAGRGWFGLKKNEFDKVEVESEEAPDQVVDTQPGSRFRRDFLTPAPLPSSIVADPTQRMPYSPPYETHVILDMLLAFRKNSPAFNHVFESTMNDVMSQRAAWYSVYLACQPELRHKLKAPTRLHPEWCRLIFARQNTLSGQGVTLTLPIVESALASIEAEIEVIVAHETELGQQSATAPPITRNAKGRFVLPLPDFASSPAARRDLHRAGIFIPSEALQLLYDDRDKLKTILKQGRKMARRRWEQLAQRASELEAVASAAEREDA